MASEKLIIVLITIAIILSVISVAITISSINSKMIPEINAKPQAVPDKDNVQVSIIINPYNYSK